MTCDPKSRKVLVTDGTSTVGQALVRALAAAGADTVWDGVGQSAVSVRSVEFSDARYILRIEGGGVFADAVLRDEMHPAGVRVINVFPGPIEDEGYQESPPPKITPHALANAIVRSLQEGLEDVYPGDVAQEWLARWRDNPKVLERELSVVGR
jgi:NAD(P)-dependent dehydrogenase (short-subunit alcohol dehydrogenase family)